METFEQTTQDQVRRPSLLLDVRNYQCSFVCAPNEKGSDPLRRGISNGGNSLHNAGGRIEGMPPADRGTGAQRQLRNSDEFDPFADWQNSTPVVYPDDIDGMSPRTAYLIGRSEGMEQQFKNLLPAIDQAIEIAMR